MSAGLVWFRRDLRDFDHAPLAAALASHERVHCAFVFDTEILDPLAGDDARVSFIRECVKELDRSLRARGGGLIAVHGRAREEVPRLARELRVESVFVGRDYEPQAAARDDEVAAVLERDGIRLRGFKDQVIFEADEVLTAQGKPYTVFTPYRNAWLKRLTPPDTAARDVSPGAGQLVPGNGGVPSLVDLGFDAVDTAIEPGMTGGRRAWEAFQGRIAAYADDRDFPARAATSGLSAHLRFGTVSIRELVRFARSRRSAGAAAWLSELVWREFYFAALSVRPDSVDHAWHPGYDALAWERDEGAWDAWRGGATGYPLVDAAMRELAARGTMHNRLRMVTASFLVKDLGLDWRRGERHFAARLLDYDQAANVGNWQWCASTGSDAQPWFRIFNPVTQSRRFDPDGAYIRRWVPELAHVADRRVHAPWEMSEAEQQAARCVIGRDYPPPVVDHGEARARTLGRYEAVQRK